MRQASSSSLLLFSSFFSCFSCFALVAGCSAGSGPVVGMTGSSQSGVSGNAPIGTLSDAERREVCDWIASNYGGYGQKGTTVQCKEGYSVTPKAPKSQESCVTDMAKVPSTCRATVSESEDCILYLQANQCGAEKNPPACATLLVESCMGKASTVTVVEDPPASNGSAQGKTN